MPTEQLPDTTYPTDGRLKNNDRLTIITQIHHDHTGRPTFSGEVRFDRVLETVDQPFHRELEVGEEVTQIEAHWIKRVGHLLIENVTGKVIQLQPSDAEKKETAKKIVRVSFGLDCVNGILIRPSSGYVFEVEDFSSVWIKSLFGKAQLNVYLFPA